MALVIQLYGTKRPSTARVEGRFSIKIIGEFRLSL
jgi:hypothetical protein